MGERLFGMETEYGVNIILNAGESRDTDHLAEELVQFARNVPHVPARRSSGLFLANGARLYVDCGAHPELATPECTNPWDVCRYLQAGDRLLLELAGQQMRDDRRIQRTLVRKGNVDYLARSTWGCHESYLHGTIDQDVLSQQIIPHLVSRIIFSGAGGFDCFSPGIDFMVSPRVAHLSDAVSASSTGGRGIFHTKDEPLCDHGYHRLHVLCGESLCSETATWLKVSTTALIVALIDAGIRPGTAVEFADPVSAMRTFAGDPTCSRRAALANGREVTALDVQREFLRHAEAHAETDFMPPWAGEVCRQWRAMLDRLQHGAARVATVLDWAIKLTLFQNHARRRGTTLEALAKWTPVLKALSSALEATCGEKASLTAALVLGRKSPLAAARKNFTPILRKCGLEWTGLAAVLGLRLELFEIDTRYSLLGEGGIFTALDSAGVLDHHFPGVDNFEHALANPPACGRAAIRGAVIRRVAGHNGRFAAEWDGVWDLKAGQELDLTDPFCTSEKWEKSKAPVREPTNPEHLFRIGRYAEMLDPDFLPLAIGVSPESTVIAYARIGRRDEALALLESLPPRSTECHPVALKLSILSNGLVPAVEEMEPLITICERLIEEEPDAWNAYSRFVFRSYQALHFLHQGAYQLAEPLFVSLISDESHAMRSRLCSRNRCHLAELYRRLGRAGEAEALVKTAERTYCSENLPGDMAAHALPMLAKLTDDASKASSLLAYAAMTHRSHHNDLGLMHALCLRARRRQDPSDRERIMALQQAVPVLRTCEVARQIVDEWDSWLALPANDDPIDYWGL